MRHFNFAGDTTSELGLDKPQPARALRIPMCSSNRGPPAPDPATTRREVGARLARDSEAFDAHAEVSEIAGNVQLSTLVRSNPIPAKAIVPVRFTFLGNRRTASSAVPLKTSTRPFTPEPS